MPKAKAVYDALGNRVATKVNDEWRFMVYDAFGKMVAEYGNEEPNITAGLKFVHQDWQGSVRTVTNRNGYVINRTDHQAFGDNIGAGIGDRNTAQGYLPDQSLRQGYGMTENDEGSGQQHTWFRKLETQAGRWTSPDPYKDSMNLGDPQSFNRYTYVTNDPVNMIDPSGLYEACAHEEMTRFLGNLAGLDSSLVDRLAGYTGDSHSEAADAKKWAATTWQNILEWDVYRTGPWAMHFPTEQELRRNIGLYPSHIASGAYQQAGFTLHSIQDGIGAHSGIRNIPGHTISNLVGRSVDRILGDNKFIRAALGTLNTMSGGRLSTLTPQQINDLIDAIVAGCKGKNEGGDFNWDITRPPATVYGGGGGGGGEYFPGYYPYHYYWNVQYIWRVFITIEVVTVTVVEEE